MKILVKRLEKDWMTESESSMMNLKEPYKRAPFWRFHKNMGNTLELNKEHIFVKDKSFRSRDCKPDLFCCKSAGDFFSFVCGNWQIHWRRKVRAAGRTLSVIDISIGIVLAGFLFILRKPLLSMYNLTEEATVLADHFIMIMSVIMIGMSYQMPVSVGIIQGGGILCRYRHNWPSSFTYF